MGASACFGRPAEPVSISRSCYLVLFLLVLPHSINLIRPMPFFLLSPAKGSLPVFNSACPWASSEADLKALYLSPWTSAVTTRTCTLNGFEDDASKHQVCALARRRTLLDLAGQAEDGELISKRVPARRSPSSVPKQHHHPTPSDTLPTPSRTISPGYDHSSSIPNSPRNK